MEPNVLITQLYVGYYNRAPDPEGLNYWIGRYKAGVSLADIANSFAASPEAISTYPYLAFPNVSTAETFLEQVYQNLFNRSIDADGRAYYANKLATGQTTPGQIIAEIQANANTNTNNTDGQVLANKVTVGLDFALEAASTPGFKYEGAAVNQANTILDSVTSTQASVDAALASNDAFFGEDGAGTPGDTFTLTTGTDVINGSTGNDKIIAGEQVSGGVASGTLTAGDTINGGAGTDTLQLFGASAGSFAAANISGVEVVEAQLAGGSIDVSKNADVKEVTVLAGSTGANTVTLTKAQAGGIQGNVTVAPAGGDTVEFKYSDATAATNDVAKVELNGATVDGVTIAGIETLNIDAAGKNNVGTLTLANATTLNVTGAGSLSAVATAAGLKTVDASANTGGLTLTLAGTATDLSVKGSSANDTLTTTFAALTSADVIDLGAGTNDTLLFSDAATISVAADATKLSKVSGVEELGTVATKLTVDGDLVTQTRFSTSGVGSLAVTNAAQGTTLEFGAGVAAASTAGLKLGANTLNVELQGGSAAADLSNDLTVTGSSTINVSSNGKAGVAANVLDLVVADNQLVNLTGSQDTTLTVTNSGLVTGVSIDASTFTGKANITATAQADIVKGGAGADVINGGAGADVLTGGAGNDKFVVAGAGVASAADADVITDFVTKADTIDFSGAAFAVAGSATTYKEGTAAVADFAAAKAAADAIFAGDATTVYVAQQVGADTFVFAGTAAGAVAEDVVKLTGVSLAGIEAVDIVA